MIQQTSLEAYWSLGSKINERQQQILNTLLEIEPANNREIAEKSHLPINAVTPRILELRSKGRVELAYKDKDSVTGRKTIYWKVK